MSYQWNFKDQLHAHFARKRTDSSLGTSKSIRLRRMTIGGEPRNVLIRLVETRKKIDAACELVNDRYAWRGYGDSHHIPADAHHMTFTAEVDEEIVGTITLAIDSSSGLAIDKAFAAEVDAFRCMPDTRVCELTKFAFSPKVQSKELMAALFHIVFVYGSRAHGGTDLFIEVNPRHVRFYESMLGFQKLGGLKQNESVAAPAQLMWLKVSEIRDQILQCGGTHRSSARSLYPFFFSPTEEDGIYRRLIAAETELIELPDNEEELTGLATSRSPVAVSAQLSLAAAALINKVQRRTPNPRSSPRPNYQKVMAAARKTQTI